MARRLLVGLLLLWVTQLGCPRCGPPVRVELVDELTGEPIDDVSPYRVSFSYEGSPFEPCASGFCGEGTGGCGVGAAGSYLIRVELGDQRWEEVATVEDSVCVGAGVSVDIPVAAAAPTPPSP